MKFPAGARLPVVHEETRWQTFRKSVCDFPIHAGGKMRKNLSNVLFHATTKSFLVGAIVLLLGSFAILQLGSIFSVEHALPPRLQSLVAKAAYVIEREWRYFVPLQCDVCMAISIGDDGDQPNDKALPYPLVSTRLIEALKEEVASARAKGKVHVLVGVDYSSIVCKIVRDTFAETPNVRARCRPFPEIFQGTTCYKLIVGATERFVPQLPVEFNLVVDSQIIRAVDLDGPDLSREPPALLEKDWRPTVVTGFSSNHVVVGLLLLRSIGKAMENYSGQLKVSVIVWAMEKFNAEHQRLMDCVIEEMDHIYGVEVEVRPFDWDAYPPWMRINQKLGYMGGTGEYAWKAIMIHTILRERGMVLWADGGDRFHGTDSLVESMKTLQANGFVSRSKDGNVRYWTHLRQLMYFRANIPEVLDTENCVAAAVGFTLKKYRDFARPWYDCSMTRQCIAPDGSNRKNHRQDQAALTVLSVLSKSPCTGAHWDWWDHAQYEGRDGGFDEVSGTYETKCYNDPLQLTDQGYDPGEHG